MPTLQFSKNMFRRGRQFENSSARLVRRTARRTLRHLVFNTKVDTGEARSNWRVGVGTSTRSTIDPYVPYKKRSKANGQGINESANANAAIAAGNARINSVRGISGVGLKTSIYISNNVPHINKALLPGTLEGVRLQVAAVIKGFRFFGSDF